MILASNRYPGQMMPVGARYWYNAGRHLNVLSGSPDGLGGPLAISGLGSITGGAVLGGIIRAGLGYYIGTNLTQRNDAKRAAGVVGALTGSLLGVPGLALTTFLYAARKK